MSRQNALRTAFPPQVVSIDTVSTIIEKEYCTVRLLRLLQEKAGYLF